jgi:O-antigen ligase
MRLAIGLVFAVSIISPATGLLAVAVAAPFGELSAVLLGLPVFRASEAVVLAFLAGWLLRGAPDRPGPRLPTVLGWLLSALVVSSVAGQMWRAGFRAIDGPALFHFFQVYFMTGEEVGYIAGAHLIEGLALAAATIMLFRQHPRLADTLPAAVTASAAAAAIASVVMWFGIAPAAAVDRLARLGYRVTHLADVNAAGSYFGMILCLGAGMAARARGRSRTLWAAGVATAFIGLRMSVSRSALYAVVTIIALALAWAATLHWPERVRLAGLAALLCVALALGYARTMTIERDPTFQGAGFRQQFNATSLRMIRARPLFGLGIGQYYAMAPLFLSPQLAWTYGFENAHNYFLQVGAELGVAGLVLFAAWIGVVLVRSARAIAAAPRDWRLLGAAGGVATVCVTCLSGHPLLVDDVLFPFWILFGLTAGLGGSVLLSTGLRGATDQGSVRAGRRPWIAATALAGVIVATTAINARQRPIGPVASPDVDGFYPWETAPDGTRFRWTGRYASVFVPAEAREVWIPVRIPEGTRAISPIAVEVMSAGIGRGRTIVNDTWTEVYSALGDVPAPSGYKRIDIRIDRTWQPALYIPGSADLRTVGVQIGEPRVETRR